MSELLQITGFPAFDNSIIRKEFRSYNPYSDSFRNNDEIRLTINNQDLIVLPSESYLCCTLNYTAKVGANSAPEDKRKLQNNFLAYMFEEIRYELNGVEIDKTRNLGYATTIKNYMSLSREESNCMTHMGWFYGNENNAHTGGKFDICLPLKKLLGFCEDYKKVILNAKHELILVRSKTDKNSVLLNADVTSFDLKIERIQWKMPHIQVTDNNKLTLMRILNKDKPLTIPFRSWDLYEFPTLPRTNKHIWNVKTSNLMEKPRYIILCLQTNRKDKTDKNSSVFDSNKLNNARVFLNSVPYPAEDIRFNFQDCYSQVYEAYSSFQRVYFNRENAFPLLTMNELKDQGLVFVDCSHQDETLKSGVVDLSIHMETNGDPFPESTSAFCLIIHDRIIEYNPLTNIVRKLV